MDGERGPIRSDWASQLNWSLLGANRPDMAAMGGKIGLGVSTAGSVAEGGAPGLSELRPEKLCSNGLGSMSSFEHA